MTHFNAETLEEITDVELSERYDSYLDDSGEYEIRIDGNDLIPSEVLKETDPIAYDESLRAFINQLYDAGILASEWDRADRIKELCHDWAFDVMGEVMDYTTTVEDDTIHNTLFKLFGRGVLELDSGEIQLSSNHSMAEVLIALGAALDETKK